MIEVILVITNLSTAFCALYLWKRPTPKIERKNSIELDEFIRDLMTGGAIVEIKRLPPENIVIRQRRL